MIGHLRFGVPGAIAGGVIGGVVGLAIGSLPRHLTQEFVFRKMQRSSNDELRAMLEHKLWAFNETLALLNLQVRGEDVQPYLPRVLSLLESEGSLERVFGRDALRLVFTPLAKQLDDFGYDPGGSTEDCRSAVAKLREAAP